MKNTNRIKFIRSAILILFASVLVFGSAVSVSAASTYPKPDDNIADEAGVLSESTIRSVQKTNESLYEDVGAMIAICTVATTGDEDIETYARNVFKEWKLGEGVLLLIAADDENYYFIQSVGVDKVLTNEVLEEIRDGYLEEDFAAGNIDRGVIKCVTKITSVLTSGLSAPAEEAADDAEKTDEDGEKKGTTVGGVIVGFFKFILYVVLIAVVLFIALFVWAMFNDDVAAILQKYIFKRGSSGQYRMPEEYYDDRLYGSRQQRRGQQGQRPRQNARPQQGQQAQRSRVQYDAYGNPIRQQRPAERPAQRPQQYQQQGQMRSQQSYPVQQNRQSAQSQQYSGDETRAFTIPGRDSRR